MLTVHRRWTWAILLLVRGREGRMFRNMVGLLAAIGAAMSVLAVLAHPVVILLIVAVVAGAATGLAARLALLPIKKGLKYPNSAPGLRTPLS
jgi:hypothetical protein